MNSKLTTLYYENALTFVVTIPREHMRNFMLKIKENLELKYEHLRGLNGL